MKNIINVVIKHWYLTLLAIAAIIIGIDFLF